MVDWRQRAACLHEDPELFFPTGDTATVQARTEEAKAVCHRCAVVTACLTWALQHPQSVGVWGGRTERERRPLLQRRAHTRRVS